MRPVLGLTKSDEEQRNHAITSVIYIRSEQQMKIDGRCHCGQITYEAEVDPSKVEICHCSDCQTLSGSAYRTVVPAEAGTFWLLTGEPKGYVKVADSGSHRTQWFCSNCGTPIYSAATDGESSFLGIRVGTIRQRDQLQPKAQYWCRSAQEWSMDISSMEKFETQ